MPAVLPLVCLALIMVAARLRLQSGWRIAVLAAFLVWAVLITAITELASLFGAIRFGVLLLIWSACTLVAAFAAWQRLSMLRNEWARLVEKFRALSALDLAMLPALGAIVGTLALTAWVAAPNTSDSMSYHMSRVLHWIQNGSVAHYPTAILRQLHMNPWSEFAILQFQVLSGGDRFANLIQFLAMLGSLVGVSLIAAELGAGARGQIFSAVIVGTLPMGILQATSTQTDYSAALWLVCLAFFGLRLRRGPGRLEAAAFGASLGLAVLTKATAYLFAAPFVLWAGLSLVRQGRAGWQATAMIASLALTLNAGHYARNYDLYRSPLGPGWEVDEAHAYANTVFSLQALASNAVRNLALHLGTPYPSVNMRVTEAVWNLHDALGIASDDPRTTWAEHPFYVPLASTYEGEAGNLLHLLVIALALPVYFAQKRDPARADLGRYGLLVLAAFLLFSFYLRWQPWSSRLQLPLFILSAPFLGVVLSSALSSARTITALLLWSLLLASIPWVIGNKTRPLVGERNIFETDRTTQYFARQKWLQRSYTEMIEYLNKTECTRVGTILGWDSWEYPLLRMLDEDAAQILQVEQIQVSNVSATLATRGPTAQFDACAVIVVRDPFDFFFAGTLELHGDTFVLKRVHKNVGVYLKR